MSGLLRFFTPYELTKAQRAFLIPYFGIGALVAPEHGDYIAGSSTWIVLIITFALIFIFLFIFRTFWRNRKDSITKYVTKNESIS